ncbi:F5 [Branchiostoma lanceolatum]|uniref:F5 protein n=1 Tax=Branchiostoma lanceolatum TaxID=7740 RepID=A0A8S4MMC4_BRALA|nr:F5 [Branchiostoma lanceolatum]
MGGPALDGLHRQCTPLVVYDGTIFQVGPHKHFVASVLDPRWMVAITYCTTSSPLGMESGAIPNSHITASTEQTGYEAWRGRLNNGKAWQTNTADTDQWLQIDLGSHKVITGIQTQGLWGYHIKSYKLMFSDDASTCGYPSILNHDCGTDHYSNRPTYDCGADHYSKRPTYDCAAERVRRYMYRTSNI